MGTRGGLKLKRRHETGFIAIYNMLNRPGSTLKLLTYTSLKGFIFTVTVAKDEDGGYLDYDGNKFKKDVTSYLLKIAVISSINDGYLPTYRGVTKRTESEESYFDEAIMQQTVWKKSISTGGKSPICPPVANLSLFGNSDSEELLSFLISKTITSPETKEVLDYMRDTCITPFYGLSIGVIVMPMIQNSKTFNDYSNARALIVPTRSTRTTDRIVDVVLDEVYIDAAAELIRLFIDIGVLHFDAHIRNVLVYTKIDSSPKCVIIDFGRASNIQEDFDDEYMNRKEKEKARANKDVFYDQFFKHGNNKIKFIKKACEYYRSIDFTKNTKIFGTEQTDAQSDWLWIYVAEQPDEFYEKVYDKLKNIITVTEDRGIQAGTITKLEKEGRFFNINGSLQDFKVSFPRPTNQSQVKTTRKRKAKTINAPSGKSTQPAKKTTSHTRKSTPLLPRSGSSPI